jgi:pilus assembly protein Flp/PilA
MRIIEKLRRDERGATAVEYGLILALIFVAVIGAVRTFSGSAMGMWNVVASNVSSNM